MYKHLMIPALILLLTACSPTPTVAPLSPTTDSNSPTTIPATPAPQEIISIATIQATSIVVSANTAGSLWLQVLSPQDEAVLDTPQVDVIGSAPAWSVVSVNDDILLVGDDGQFKITIALDEGPNLIEIVASDDNGNETSLILAVTYEP